MEIRPEPRITYVERMSGGVVVTFEDGRCAVYSAALLNATFSQAEDLTDLPNPDDEHD